MLSPHHHDTSELPHGHPCRGCPVRENAVCGVLTGDDLCTFRRLGCTLSLSRGETLFQEGEPALSVFTVTQGVLKSYRLLADGRRQVMGFHYPGDCIGSTFDDEHGCTVEVVQDARICAFPIRRFDEFVDDHPPMERELYIAAARGLAIAQTQMLLLGRKTAAERMASFFLALSEREGGGDTIELPMSRSDIADFLGLTKETVSRVLADLRNDRLIRLLAIERVQILDRARLKAIAEGCSA